MQSLSGKHIVVTGASAGIGAEICRQLAKQGCKITLAARREEKLQQVASEIVAAGGEANAVITDVTERQQVFALADSARACFGGIDVWINNAGGGMLHSLLDATDDDMRWLHDLNCMSSLWAYQAVIPAMVERGGGQVIDINSLGGKAGFAYGGGYVSAKAAMSALGDTMRQELIGTGVHLTTIYPGVTESDFSKVRPDRTDGSALGDGTRLRQKKSFLTNTVLKQQSAKYIADVTIHAIQRPVPTVYPHRWATFAVWLFNHYPALMLKVIERGRKQSG